MIIDIKIPAAGESVTEAAIGNWLVEDGSYVEKDQEIAEVETDKATLPLIAPESGKIKIVAAAGNKVQIGDIACSIDTESKGVAERKTITTTPSAAAASSEEHMRPAPSDTPSVTGAPPEKPKTSPVKESSAIKITPLAQSIMDQNSIDVEAILSGLKKITRHDVEQVIHKSAPGTTPQKSIASAHEATLSEGVERTPMSPLRRKISKRLVSVKNETAMLTTFNEVDMSSVMDIRKKYQPVFQEKYGQKLGMVSFFAMACSKALLQFPKVNSYIDGDDMITPRYVDIAIAVQTDKGLMAPVIRNTGSMSLAELELSISAMAQKARSAKLSIEEMTGGTFTITNGGVFGSMLSTPILNPPQSAILGMHNIVDRAVVIKGKIEVRPIMYVALSYDHRLIDGSESVSFLVKVKEMIESPINMLLQGSDPEKLLLGI